MVRCKDKGTRDFESEYQRFLMGLGDLVVTLTGVCSEQRDEGYCISLVPGKSKEKQ